LPEQFKRRWEIRVGTTRISGQSAGDGEAQQSLDCSFEIEKSTEREPNSCSLTIINLSPSNRSALDDAATFPVRVSAGYPDMVSMLFDGDVRTASSRRRPRGVTNRAENVDVLTEIEAEDGGQRWRNATVQRSYAPGVPVATVLRDTITALGIGEGNLNDVGTVGLNGEVATFTQGTTLSGQAHREVDRIVRSLGLRWSIQNGALQLRGGTTPITTTAIRLSPTTGLIGSPAPDADGTVTAVALLNGGLYPGRPVVLESRETSGSYAVKRVRHVGDTAAQDWQSELTLEAR